MGSMDLTQLPHSSKIRCPYCADGTTFRVMVSMGSSDLYFCRACGHVSLPSAPFYQCICENCCKLENRRRLLTHGAFPLVIPKARLLEDVYGRVRNLFRAFRRIGVPAP